MCDAAGAFGAAVVLIRRGFISGRAIRALSEAIRNVIFRKWADRAGSTFALAGYGATSSVMCGFLEWALRMAVRGMLWVSVHGYGD